MSMMRCCICSRLVDTDEDADSLYMFDEGIECACKYCRDEHELPTEFDEPRP